MYVFTDGGCTGNGGRAPRATYAALLVGDLSDGIGEIRIRGRVAASTYAWTAAGGVSPVAPVASAEPATGATPITRSFHPTPTHWAPSNNRAELLAVIAGLGAVAALQCGKKQPTSISRVEVLSDSRITVMTLAEWLPARRRAGTADALANLDLVEAAEQLLAEVRAAGAAVTLTHVAAHTPPPPAGASPRARLLWAGNDAADRAAGELLADVTPGGEIPFACDWRGTTAREWRPARDHPAVEALFGSHCLGRTF